MARNTAPGELSLGNHIYLYRLLRDALGCGKQTFLPIVEEALAAEDYTAAALGFDTTRALLEALDDFISLTVFKGGRIYATVIAQPAWDEALAASADTKKPADGKSWKRKRGDKALKAVAPRRIPAPEPEPAPAPELAPAPEPEPEAVTEPAPMPEPDSETEPETEPTAEFEPAAAAEDDASPSDSIPTVASNGTPESSPEPVTQPESAAPPSPAFKLTVTFDPDCTDAGETILESSPQTRVTPSSDTPSAMPAPDERPSAAPAPTVSPENTDEPAEPLAAPVPEVDLSIYPVDFTQEVYCPAPLLSELAGRMPLGADVMGIVGEYFHIACLNGGVETSRNRATFPVRYLSDGVRRALRVTIRKRPAAGAQNAGLAWAVDAVEVDD